MELPHPSIVSIRAKTISSRGPENYGGQMRSMIKQVGMEAEEAKELAGDAQEKRVDLEHDLHNLRDV